MELMLKFEAPSVFTNNWMHTYLINIGELTQQDGKDKKTANLAFCVTSKRDNNFVSETFPPNFTLL